MNVIWNGETLQVIHSRYLRGNVALRLVGQTGEPHSTPTDDPADALDADEVCVKSHFEHEGVLQALLDGGVLVSPHRTLTSGHVQLHVYRLTPFTRTGEGQA